MTNAALGSVRVRRETELYGRPVVEKWRGTLVLTEDGEQRLECSVDVRPPKGEGSKPIYKQDDIDPLDVPYEVLQKAMDQTETLWGRMGAYLDGDAEVLKA